MLRSLLILLAVLLFAPSPAMAENPWGPECKTLEECLEGMRKQMCPIGDICSGLQIDFEKFGREAVPPLLQLMFSDSSQIANLAAEHLGQNQNVLPEDREIVFKAWRKGVENSYMIASNLATPEFVREVMGELRKNPVEGSLAYNTFANLREDEDSPGNGVNAAATEHIECSAAEACNSEFAKLQFGWMSGNFRMTANVAQRLEQVLQNSNATAEAKLSALQCLQPNEYFNTADEMRGFVVPILQRLLSAPDTDVRSASARLLTEFGNIEGTSQLLTTAETGEPADKVQALISLASLAGEMKPHAPRIKQLLTDPDWDVRRHAVILLGAMGDESLVGDLISQVDQRDWRKAYSAVSSLKAFKSNDAKRTMQQVAKTYWHPVVRELAADAVTNDPNLSQYPDNEKGAVDFARTAVLAMRSPIHDREDFTIGGWCKSRFERDGYRFVPDFITGPEVIAEAQKASQQNADHFEKLLMEHLLMKGALSPRSTLSFGRWRFVGRTSNYPDTWRDVHTGELSVTRDGVAPRTVLSQNTVAVFLLRGEPFAITAGVSQHRRGDGFLYRLVTSDTRTWKAEPVLRLTGAPGGGGIETVWVGQDETIGVLASDGAMLIHPDLTPEWIGCPQPSFP